MKNHIHVSFYDASSMLDYIRFGHDIYSPSAGVYVFEYNVYGSICVYPISETKADELDAAGGWWSSRLGMAGSAIYDSQAAKEEEPDLRRGPYDLRDDALDWCEMHYEISDWLDVSK